MTKLPAYEKGVELSYTWVEEIPEGSDLWEAYRKQTAAALNADDVRLPGLYDISIVERDEYGRSIAIAPVALQNGTYDAKVVLETVSPVSFLIN